MNLELILKNLDAGPDILADLISDIPKDILYHRGTFKWCIAEHSNHICRADEYVFQHRLRMLLDNEHPKIEAISGESFGEDHYFNMDVHQELGHFTTTRKQTIDLIKSIPLSKLEQKIYHPEYHIYSGLILIRHMLMHDYFHMYRIEDTWLAR